MLKRESAFCNNWYLLLTILDCFIMWWTLTEQEQKSLQR